jgi:hypothetical protein
MIILYCGKFIKEIHFRVKEKHKYIYIYNILKYNIITK